ncbi:MAG TPA: glycosyltransferase [Thermoanaerobaculia bacterium]|nr:glycosyltransferase [Thermoanaerobaculia bacterium]
MDRRAARRTSAEKDLSPGFALGLAIAGALCALLPALLFRRNLALYAPPPAPGADRPAVSILIPARDEEGAIGDAVAAALASAGVDLEVIVLDDHSTDRTAAIVRAAAARDPRLRLETAPPLRAGWNGKQHACAVLAGLARHPLLLFVDADVRLAPKGAARAAAFLAASGADLASGVPRQETVTFLERLLIPLIHFVLLGFLPLARMRRSRHPAYGAGCGQLFLARREGYEKAGGHAAIRASLHDGVALPRAFRQAGLATDLFDATDVASCRMYRNALEVWRGLGKNATEGLAAPRTIVPATILLLAGQVMPPVLLLLTILGFVPATALILAAIGVGVGAAWGPRLAAVRRFYQPLDSAFLHPLGISVFLVLQWTALFRKSLGRPAAWKGRVYRI